MARIGAAIAAGAVLFGCASGPSPRWQRGGASIPIDSAYWSRSSSTVEIRPSGEVMEDDRALFRIDPRGRMSSTDGAPVAVLTPDGNLVAENGGALGWIGADAAFRADHRTPSVRITPDGRALVAREGAWTPAGTWTYCDGAMRRTCTLVTHVIAQRDEARGNDSPLEAVRLVELLRLVR